MALAGWLKQSTAVNVMVGPFVDETDGKTAETGLTIAQADVRLSKNAGNMAQKNDNTTLVHDEIGIYLCELDATDTNTLGILGLFVHEAGALPVRMDFMVVAANVYDALIGGGDLLQVDVQELEGDAQSSVDLKDFVDAGYDPSTNKVEGVKLADTLTTNNDKTGYTLTVTPPTAATIADAVWDEALATHQGAGSTGEALEDATVGAMGAGALTRTLGVTDGGNPLEGASIWVSTDEAGTNVVAGPLVTDSMGEVTVLLDAGTFYLWLQKDGYVAIVAEEFEVSA